jgi:glycosyltransferase involved in cell wall biosynthesis
MEKIQSIIDEYGIGNWVDLYGWLPFIKVQSFIKASDVCLVPHNDFEHTQTTIPHKLFQYMICSKPVLVSDCKPLKRVVEEADCGMIFKASDHKSFTEVLIDMYKNRNKLDSYGEKGRKAALSTFSWKNDARTLVNLFKSLEEKFVK